MGYTKDEESLKKMEIDLEQMIRGPTSFNGLMEKN